MTNRELVLEVMYTQGQAAALDLRLRAADMDGTAIIAEESKIPLFDPQKDYTSWAVGSPVRELVEGEYQVFGLLQPYNPTSYPGTSPSMLPAIWSIKHTKDPKKAKPFMPSSGTSGLYMLDEVCTDPNMPNPKTVYRSRVNDNAYAPSAYIQNWEEVTDA